MELQKQVAASLLWKPSLIRTNTVKPEWFTYPPYRELVNLVVATKGKEEDPIALYENLKEFNEQSTNTVEIIYNLQADGFLAPNFEKNLKMIEMRYHKGLVDMSVDKYNRNKSEDNLYRMKDRMRELEQLDTPDEDGTLSATMDEIDFELDNEVDDGIKFYKNVNTILGGGLQPGELMIIGARPAVGKSAMAINLALEAKNNNDNVVVDFFTLEMTQKQMAKRFISRSTEINSYKLRNPANKLVEQEKTTVRSAMDMLKDGTIRIFDKARTIGDISKIINRRAYENKDNRYLVMIDYIGLIRSSERKTNAREVLDEVSRELKELTTTLNIPVIALSQLNRGIEGRQEKKPMLSDLRDSGSVEQDANIVAFLHEPNKDNPDEEQYTALSVEKSREGMTGDLRFSFFKSKMYFEDID